MKVIDTMLIQIFILDGLMIKHLKSSVMKVLVHQCVIIYINALHYTVRCINIHPDLK